jgi:hypothetical protein
MIASLAAAPAQTFLPSPVNLSNTGQATMPAIAVGPAGDVDVVWLDSGAILLRRSVDGGQTFSATMTVATTNLPPQASQPQIVANAAGVYVAWAGPGDVFFSSLANGASTWLSPPVNVSRGRGAGSGGIAPVPRIAVDPSGGVDIVWGQNGAFFARSTDGGNSFATVTQLTASPMASVSPRMAVNAQGIVYVVWENAGSCPTITFARSTDSGSTFTDYPVDDTLNVNGVPQTGCAFDVQVAAGASNTVHLLWANDHSTLTTIKDLITTYQTDSGGSFQGFDATHHLGYQNLSSTASYTPEMAIDNSGTIDVVWMGEVSQNDSRQVVYFTRSTNGGSSFTSPLSLTNPPASGAKATGFPQIAVEPSGGIDISWQQASAANPSGAYDIVLARSTDGVNFTKTTLNNVPTTQGGTGQNAVDASGNVYAVWQGSSGGGGDVLLNGDSAGLIASIQFSLNGVKTSVSPASAVVNVGGSASFTLMASSTNAVAGSFTLACGGAPAGVNCSFSPNPVDLTANGSASITLSVSVSAKPSGSMAERGPGDGSRYRPDRLPAIRTATLGIGFSLLLTVLIAGYKKNGRRSVIALALVILLAVTAMGMMSCSGSTHNNGGSITFPLTLMANSNSGSASMGTISITVP